MKPRLDLIPTAQSACGVDFTGATVVVVDVLRATTSMYAVLRRGGRAVYPVRDVNEARRLKREKPDALLCGERGGFPPEGFDMGNSPAQFAAADLAGREIILTTTNGTLAVDAAAKASSILAATMLNAVSVSRRVMEGDPKSPVFLLCAGTEGSFSIEDFYCAGIVASQIESADFAELSDFAWAAAKLSAMSLEEAVNLHTCKHMSALQDKGFSEDLEFALRRESGSGKQPVPEFLFEAGKFVGSGQAEV